MSSNSFAARVIRLRKHAGAGLSDLEKEGNPHVLASAMADLTPEFEERLIGPPRASSLYSCCIRRHVMGSQLDAEQKQWAGFKSKVTYGIGNAIHFWMQNTPDVFGMNRVGWWKCWACGKIRYFGKPPGKNKRCEHCNALSAATFYHEHRMKVDMARWLVTGHPDLFWLRPKKVLRVVEIKTISGDMFPNLKAPLIEHVWQTQTYMWGLTKDNKMPVPIDDSVGYVLYISKKEHADQFPMKMFPVEKDGQLLRRIRYKLKQYRDGMNDYPTKVPDMHKECVRNADCYRANTCGVKKECFELAAA